ncbi:MAG: SapC family protein [Novosphingobium sp.]
MASAPQSNPLPLFYKDLMPLNSRDHASWSSRTTETAAWMVGQHAIPLTAEEFVQASRHFPIVFSIADNPVPLALMGLNEGVNTFFDDEGKISGPVYVPAYARRYPFMLAKLTPDTEELSLCFDPTSDLVGEFTDGTPLFNGEEPSDSCKATLDFCRNFEEAGFRTQAFVEELMKHDLLMDGEVSIQQEGNENPFVYRGFKMVDQEKLRELRGDVLRSMNQSGMLALVFAHLFSLEHMSEVFGRQVQQGKGPVPNLTN